MKRVFTLLCALGLLTAADAQPGVRANRGRVGVNVVVTGNNGYQQSRFAADRKLREKIAGINFKFDRKIEQVRRSFFMHPAAKMQKIRKLEIQRQREINKAIAKSRHSGKRHGHSHHRY